MDYTLRTVLDWNRISNQVSSKEDIIFLLNKYCVDNSLEKVSTQFSFNTIKLMLNNAANEDSYLTSLLKLLENESLLKVNQNTTKWLLCI